MDGRLLRRKKKKKGREVVVMMVVVGRSNKVQRQVFVCTVMAVQIFGFAVK